MYDADIHCELVERFAHEGMTDAELSKRIGISESTLNKWKVKHPEFKAALAKGRNKADDRVEAKLFKRCMGYEVTETEEWQDLVPIERTIEHEDGTKEVIRTKKMMPTKKKTTVKHIQPDTTAMIFFLKCRRPDLYGQIAQTSDPEAESEFKKLIASMEAAAKATIASKGLTPPQAEAKE